MKQFHIYVSALAALLLSVNFGMADTVVHSDQSVLLSDLIGGGTLSVGDKTFSDFTYSQVGDMPLATEVDVIPIISDGDFGIRFAGSFIDMVGGGVSDSLITFTVEAPSALIQGARLSADLVAPVGGVATISETFLPQLPNTLMTIAADVNLDASTSFAPVQKLLVQKDILLLAGADAPSTLSFVDQAFPQVPEPSSAVLILMGLAGCMMYRRQR